MNRLTVLMAALAVIVTLGLLEVRALAPPIPSDVPISVDLGPGAPWGDAHSVPLAQATSVQVRTVNGLADAFDALKGLLLVLVVILPSTGLVALLRRARSAKRAPRREPRDPAAARQIHERRFPPHERSSGAFHE